VLYLANYECCSKTNYFKVTDLKKLRQIVSGIEGAELWTENDRFAFGTYDDILVYYDENDEECDTVEAIQSILPYGEVAIFMEIGNEKLRYINAQCIVATKEKALELDLFAHATAMARKLINDPDGITDFTF
jgi:hypothetical protein